VPAHPRREGVKGEHLNLTLRYLARQPLRFQPFFFELFLNLRFLFDQPLSGRVLRTSDKVKANLGVHSYPDWFRFHVTKWHGFRQIGNSVPPFLARAVASEIVRAMRCRPKPSSSLMELGDERLLELTLASAAEHFGVSSKIIGKRLRRRSDEISHARRAA